MMRKERTLSDDLLIEEFLEALEQRAAEKYKRRIDQAFVSWYVEAEFGRVDWAFTDDAGDGGIDAVVKRPGERPPVVLIQSKFSKNVDRGLLAPSGYKSFHRVVEAFYGREEDEFASFLETVRADAKRHYRTARESLNEINLWPVEQHAFQLVTTLNARRSLEHSRLPESSYRYAPQILELYRQFRKGHTPKARDLELRVEDKLSYKDPRRGVTSYMFNARVSDFREYFAHSDVGRLVARNIRFNLAGKVGRQIRETYERSPPDFWYLHNGMTIICDDFSEKNQTATLMNPSVVNGAQTLYAISSSSRRKSDALVAVRAVVRGQHRAGDHEDDEWVQRIIRGVNTQNRVRNQDFRSNEPEQLELQQLFRDQGVFYERKRGEFREFRNDPRFKGFERTSLKNIGMTLTATAENDGSGVVLVKRGVEAIFEEENYKKLFPARRQIRRRFERIYLTYRLAAFVRASAFRGLRKYRHAYWTAVWLANQGILNDPRFFTKANIDSIRKGFELLDGHTRAGISARAELKRLRRDLWSAWKAKSRTDRDRWTPVNFFKSRPAHKGLLTSVFPKHRVRLRAIGKVLLP